MSTNANGYFSKFQLLENYVTQLNIENKVKVIPESDNVLYQSTLNPDIGSVKKTEEGWEGEFSLGLKADVILGDELLYSISLTQNGVFFGSRDMPESEFRGTLILNGTSMLYAIIRADIIAISALTLEAGQIRMPALNVNDFIANYLKNEDQEEKQGE